jgi:hypothetical protein
MRAIYSGKLRCELTTPIRGEIEVKADGVPGSQAWFGELGEADVRVVPLKDVDLNSARAGDEQQCARRRIGRGHPADGARRQPSAAGPIPARRDAGRQRELGPAGGVFPGGPRLAWLLIRCSLSGAGRHAFARYP